MDCILVRPPFHHTGFDQEVQESLGTAYLLAVLRVNGYSAALLDGELQHLTSERIINALNTLRPAVIGFSIMSEYTLDAVDAISQGLQRTESWQPHLTAGGYLPSFFPDKLFQEIPFLDSIIRYEGEVILPELVRNALSGNAFSTVGLTVKDDQIKLKPSHQPDVISDLDQLPLPGRDLLPQIIKRDFPTTISSSRGCSGNCAFCAINVFYKASCGKPLRMRSAENVLSEIRYLNQIYGSTVFNFIDDDFIGNSANGFNRARDLGRLIRAHCPGIVFYFECRPDLVDEQVFLELKAAGLAGVFLGIDSAVENTRLLYNKRCSMETVKAALKILKDLKIKVDAGFIPFHPEVSFNDIKLEYEFLFEHNLDNPQTLLNRLYCTDESVLSQSLLEKGLLSRDSAFELTYEFQDEQVSLLHKMASVAIKPLFPAWYKIYRKNEKARNRALLAGEADRILPETKYLQEANAEIRQSIKQIINYIDTASDQDMLSFTRNIKCHLKVSLEKIDRGRR